MSNEADATLVIVGFALCLGLILAVPGLWRARKKAKEIPTGASGGKHMTPSGFFYCVIFAAFIIYAFNLNYLSPDLAGYEYLACISTVFIVGIIGEKIANMLGIKLVKQNEDQSTWLSNQARHRKNLLDRLFKSLYLKRKS